MADPAVCLLLVQLLLGVMTMMAACSVDVHVSQACASTGMSPAEALEKCIQI
jgi:hypothetical protein